jgi:glycosyltransferase involved in cell wall biosynthesis
MFAAVLLTGLVAAPLATGALFVEPVLRGKTPSVWASMRRVTLVLIGTGVLAALAAAALWLMGVTIANLAVGALGLVVVSAIWLPVTQRWSARAHVCWSATTYLFAAYLVFMIWWLFTSGLGAAGIAGGMLLWLLELVAALLGCAYLWDLCDALGRDAWMRRVGAGVIEPVHADALPFVSLQVPAYNEPPDMVIATLESLLALDYPSYQVIAIDDNTEDESLWHPVRAWCRAHAVTFAHLENWPGHTSGALNYALSDLIDPRTELIGVIDADYQVEPQFLRRCAPLFANPDVGFIQATPDYRHWQQAPFYRRLYYASRYFSGASQLSRNEPDDARFAGSMGLIRRRAIDQVGGWDEWCVTEDAELSLRLLSHGWTGLHVDAAYGKGVMPLTFEALKAQRFRRSFGGVQILRRHWRLMIPGRRSATNRMTFGQRWAYLSSTLQWYGDLLALLFYGFLLVGAANVAFSDGLLFRKLTGFLLAAIPMLAALGLIRALALLRRGSGASWRDALGAFMIWQSTALVVARASLRALYAKDPEFLPAPKTAEHVRWFDAIRANPGETTLAVLGLAGIVGALSRASDADGVLTAVLLVWPTLAFASAPLNSWSAQRAALPVELGRRRRTEYRRYGMRHATFALSGLVSAAGAVALAVMLLVPGGAQLRSPNPLPPAQGHGADTPSSTSTSTPDASPSPRSTANPGGTGSSGSSPIVAPPRGFSFPGSSSSSSSSGSTASKSSSSTAPPSSTSTSPTSTADPSTTPTPTDTPTESPTTTPDVQPTDDPTTAPPGGVARP